MNQPVDRRDGRRDRRIQHGSKGIDGNTRDRKHGERQERIVDAGDEPRQRTAHAETDRNIDERDNGGDRHGDRAPPRRLIHGLKGDRVKGDIRLGGKGKPFVAGDARLHRSFGGRKRFVGDVRGERVAQKEIVARRGERTLTGGNGIRLPFQRLLVGERDAGVCERVLAIGRKLALAVLTQIDNDVVVHVKRLAFGAVERLVEAEQRHQNNARNDDDGGDRRPYGKQIQTLFTHLPLPPA